MFSEYKNDMLQQKLSRRGLNDQTQWNAKEYMTPSDQPTKHFDFPFHSSQRPKRKKCGPLVRLGEMAEMVKNNDTSPKQKDDSDAQKDVGKIHPEKSTPQMVL